MEPKKVGVSQYVVLELPSLKEGKKNQAMPKNQDVVTP